MSRSTSRKAATAVAVLSLVAAGAVRAADAVGRAKETPLSMVEALHTAFGDHHDRAVHTKGMIIEGSFAPEPAARDLVKAPIFAKGALPIVARFSLFAGVPDLPDNDDAASPAGFAFKVIDPAGDDFDVEANQHENFIVATFDEFAVFLRALAVSGPGAAHPTQVEQFLAGHPKAAQFLASRTYPVSFASAAYFGINALKFTNAAGKSAYVRYRFVPEDGEHYLPPAERKARGGSYLQEDIVRRLARGPVRFAWYAQVAGPGDRIADPSTAWPETRRQVKLGMITLTKPAGDQAAVGKTLLFLPGQSHPGVEPADPMLVMRNAAYPISLGQRQ